MDSSYPTIRSHQCGARPASDLRTAAANSASVRTSAAMRWTTSRAAAQASRWMWWSCNPRDQGPTARVRHARWCDATGLGDPSRSFRRQLDVDPSPVDLCVNGDGRRSGHSVAAVGEPLKRWLALVAGGRRAWLFLPLEQLVAQRRHCVTGLGAQQFDASWPSRHIDYQSPRQSHARRQRNRVCVRSAAGPTGGTPPIRRSTSPAGTLTAISSVVQTALNKQARPA